MTFQGYIDRIPAGRPFEARDEEAALREMDARYDGFDCGAEHLTEHGEVIQVEVVR